MIGIIVGVSVGCLIFLVLCILIWRKFQNKHALEVQKRTHDHEFEMQESRNRGEMLRLADTPQGLRAVQLLMGLEGQNGQAANRLALGPGNGPHGGGGGGRVVDVSPSQSLSHIIRYWESNNLVTTGRLVAIVVLTIFAHNRCSKCFKQLMVQRDNQTLESKRASARSRT